MENGSGGSPRYRILVSVIQQGDRLPQVTIWGARRAAGPTLKRAQCTRQWADLDHRCLVILARRGGRFIVRGRARPMNHSQELEPPQNPGRFRSVTRLPASSVDKLSKEGKQMALALCYRIPGQADRKNAAGARHVAHAQSPVIRFDAASRDGQSQPQSGSVLAILGKRQEHPLRVARR